MICRFIYTCALYFLYVYVDVIRRVVSRYKDIVLERCSYVRTFIFGSIRLHFWLRVTARRCTFCTFSCFLVGPKPH